MYYDFIQAHKRKIVIGTILFVTAIIVWSMIIIIGRIGKTPVTISVVPSNAAVTLDGHTVGNGTQWIAQGTYTIQATKDGFKTEKKSVVVTGEKEKNVAALSLTPESDNAKAWAKTHDSDYKKNETYGAIEASNNGKYFTAKNPITTKLPYNDPYYTIGYTPRTDGGVDLTISTPSPRYRFYAVEKIRELGYDPTDFVIVLKKKKNPLGDKK